MPGLNTATTLDACPPLPAPLLSALREALGLPPEQREAAPHERTGSGMADGTAGWYRDRRVLITGAGGSIGHALCRQLLRLGPARLILLERDEHNLFEALRQLEPEARARRIELTGALCDLRHSARVDSVFRRHCPQVVLHAAACKHVPLLEENPGEAVSINIGGTRVLLDACTAFGTGRCLLVSTDKAVEPSSLMGATKRVNELMFLARGGVGDGRFRCVRLGNVLGSRGSVVPIFREQILQGGPVTLTDQAMTRYFIGLADAGRRILEAAATGHPARLFVVEMGEPVRVLDLARAMIQLLAAGTPIRIETVGARPGERMEERLLQPGERIAGRAGTSLLAIQTPIHDGNLLLDELDQAAEVDDHATIRYLLARLPIGYHSARAASSSEE